MTSSTQSPSFDDQLNESIQLIDILKRFCQDDDEQAKNQFKKQSQPDVKVNEQSRQNFEQQELEDELHHSTLSHFGSLDKELLFCRMVC
jgi:hypothetical protein